MKNQAKLILKKTFGYEEFHPLQEKIINNVLNKRDTLAIMPTGSGKSICYQIPSQIFEGITIVISPLISLMKDQVEQMNQIGIDAVLLNSSLSLEEYRLNINRLLSGKAKLLYLAPERLLKEKTASFLSSLKVDCITIDEAHCISEWGHDFRPDYRQLMEVREMFSDAVCLALTATATPRVQDDIIDILSFKDPNQFIASFDRKNLFLQVMPKNDSTSQTIEYIKKFPNQSGIIYCLTRRMVEELAERLNQAGFSARPYHAGLEHDERALNQELFIKDDIDIIVATVAFGMGINKPDVRYIIHYDLPKNLESYYQQIGRAGRDGLKSYCLLLYSYGDVKKIEYFINNMSDPHERDVAKLHLESLLYFARTVGCRRKQLLNYFGEDYNNSNCSMCDNCLGGSKELIDLTIPAQKFLSCVKRTGELFGINHIIDVLRGSTAKKVMDNQHDKLSTYGIGKEFTKKQWKHIGQQLLRERLMIRDQEYGSIKLTRDAWKLFRGEDRFLGTQLEEIDVKPIEKKQEEVEYDKVLFEILRKKRKEIADTSQIPPYTIFHDTSLIEMSYYYPQSRQSMLNMIGLGETKYDKYGKVFMDIISEYCSENNLVEKPKKISKSPKQKAKSKLKKRYITIGELYNEGYSIDDLMKKYGIAQETVISHLYKYYGEGNRIRSDGFLNYSFLNEDGRGRVFNAFTKLGCRKLKPIFEELNEEIDYGELRILRMAFLTMD